MTLKFWAFNLKIRKTSLSSKIIDNNADSCLLCSDYKYGRASVLSGYIKLAALF